MRVTGPLKERYVAARVSHRHGEATSHFVSVDGARMHFVIKGEGTPVVLIHGNPGSCEDWVKLYGPLSAHYQTIAFDRPGHGHSERPNHRDITVEVQAAILRDALHQLNIERPVLVGHSWGSALALAYAVGFPQDLAGLVLLAPAAYLSDDGVSMISKLPAVPIIGDVINYLFTPLVGASLVRSDLKKAFAPQPVPPHYLRSVLSEWTRPKKVKYYAVDDALLNASLPGLSARYAELRMPISIVTGDFDLIVSAEENAHRLHVSLPQSRLQILPQTGHQIPFTNPDAVVAAVHAVTGNGRAISAHSSAQFR
jgi:pimeloyl-ACP methyl ester carboxylesterase